MGIINNIFGVMLDAIFRGVTMITPVAALAISIIVFTFVARLLLMPLQLSSQRTSRGMSKIQPEMTKIQNKYKGRTDQEAQLKQSQEMQALYKKYKINPFAGCLPLLIQFPLIIGLFNVLRAPATYIHHLGAEYTNIATTIMSKVSNYADLLKPFEANIETMTRVNYDLATANNVTLGQFLSHLTTGEWNTFINSINNETVAQTIHSALNLKNQFETFFGLSVVDTPSGLMGTQSWAIIIPIIAGASTYIFTKLTMASNNQMQATSKDGQANPGESMMKTMNLIMPIMTGAFAYTMPIGLALYWIAGNVIMLVQQKIVNRMLEKQDAKLEAILEKEREEARKNNKTYTKKVMKKVPVQKTTEEATQDKEPKTYTKKVIKKVPVQEKPKE